MSEVVDSRVVEMDFDNRRFEANVATSMKTIDGLNKSLKFEGAAKGLEGIDKASNQVSFRGITDAVSAAQKHFSALEVAAITTLANITNAAVNAGRNLLNALTVKPITEGFSEYEMVLNAVQTTMAGTGKTMKEVEVEIGKLDEYADQTVYSTSDMLSNLSKFTNNGVELEPSVKAMIGIANATALAGGGAQQAAAGFYNLGQAVGAGYLDRMNYKSFEMANSATKEWKEQMAAAAIAAGTLTKAENGLYVVNGKSFTLQSLFVDGLQERWATTDVMLDVFNDYADVTTDIGRRAWAAAQDIKTFSAMMSTLKAQAGTGWKDTWQIVFGDLEEAKELWTGLGGFIAGILKRSSDARNELIGGWVDLGGMKKTIKSFQNLYDAAMSIINPIKEAFNEMIPPLLPKNLNWISQQILLFTKKLTLSDKAAVNLKRTFKGVFAVFSIVGQAIKAVSKLFKPMFSGLKIVSGGFLGITAGVGDWLVAVDAFLKKGEVFNKITEAIATGLTTAATNVRLFIDSVKGKFNTSGFGQFNSFLSKVAAQALELWYSIVGLKEGMNKFLLESAAKVKSSPVIQFFKKIGEAIGIASKAIGKFFGGIFKGFGELLRNADWLKVLEVVKGIIGGGIGIAIIKFIGRFTKSVKSFGKIGDSIKGVFDQLTKSLKDMSKDVKAKAILKIAIALGILALSLALLSTITPQELAIAGAAITGLFGELVGAFAILNGMKGTEKAMGSMIAIAFALIILCVALRMMSDLKFNEVIIGLGGVLALLALVIVAAKVLSQGAKDMITGSSQLILLAGAVFILAMACNKILEIPKEDLGRSIVAIGLLLLMLALYTNFASGEKKTIKASVSITVMVASLKKLIGVVKAFGELPMEVLSQGLEAVGLSLAILVIALRTLPTNTAGMGAGLMIVSLALMLIAYAMEKVGMMPMENITNALTALAGTMLILALALNYMKGTIVGAAALVVATIALNGLVPVLIALGAIPDKAIVKALTTLAIALAIIGVAAYLLAPVVDVLLILAISMGLMGAGIFALGLGLKLAGLSLVIVAGGIISLAGALTVGATAVIASIGIILLGLLGMIPLIVKVVGEIALALMKVVIELAPVYGDMFYALLMTALDAFKRAIPSIVDALLSTLDAILKSIVKYVPSIVNSIFDFLIKLLEGVAERLPDLIKAGVGVLMALFIGVVEALKDVDPEILVKGILGIALLTALMVALAAMVVLAPFAMLGVLGAGAVIAELALVLAGIGQLSKIPGLMDLVEGGGNLLQTIGVAIGKFMGGVAGGFASGTASQFPAIGTSLSEFMTNAEPFIEGAKKIDAKVIDGVDALAGAVLALTAANVLDGIVSFLTGGTSMAKFGEELAAFGKPFATFCESIKDIKPDVVVNAINAATALAGFAKNLPSSGGVADWFTGKTTSLSAFADELILFGPKLVTFSQDVADLDSSVVTNSVTAASALSAFANNLPKQGGMVTWFVGENSLSAFGADLALFGPSLKIYGESVAELDTDLVGKSTTAASAISALANNLPKSGGVFSAFTGENDLDTFGSRLSLFGTKMLEYSNLVKNLDSDVVIKSALAAESLVELQNGLDKQEGVQGLKQFGNSLVPFATKLIQYANKMSGLDVTKLTKGISEITQLIDLVNSMNGVNSEGAVAFSTSISTLAKTAISEFATTFQNSYTPVADALKSFFTNVQLGVDTEKGTLVDTFQVVYDEIVTLLKASPEGLYEVGKSMIDKLTSGAKFKEVSAKTKFKEVVDAAIAKMKESYQAFVDVGKYFVDGLCKGIADNSWKASDAAEKMIEDALTAAKEAADENSPSRETKKIGINFVLGFVNAVKKLSSLVTKTSGGMVADALKGTSSAITKAASAIQLSIDSEPTIRPVLDLTNVINGSKKLTSLLGVDRTITAGLNVDQTRNEGGGTGPTSSVTNVTYNQTISSPKYLSRIDIYRNTSNQLSNLKLREVRQT